MLRFAEEILLLILDNDDGDIAATIPPHALDTILAGAVLMDLAHENRIDTDLEKLILVDPTPVGDDLLDPVLEEITKATASHPIGHWLGRAARRGDDIRENALSKLVARGILQSDDRSLFFLTHRVSRSRRYPVIDGKTNEEVTFRIMRLLFSEDVPDPRDIVIVGLASAADIFRRILTPEELVDVQPRIDLIGGMDLIGKSVARAVARQPAAARPDESVARPANEIPMVSGWPVLGSALDLAGDLRAFLTMQYRELGPIFQFRALDRRYIALVGPEANRFVQKRGRIFLRSYETWRDFNNAMGAKDALTGMDGAAHVRMRRAQSVGFSQSFIENRLDEFVDISRGMIAEWPQDRPLIAQHEMQRLAAEQIAVQTTGVSARKYADEVIATLDSLLKVHVMRQRPELLLRLPRLKRARRRLEKLHEFVIAQHANEGSENHDLVDVLLELHRSDAQFLPETDLPLAVLGPFFAGVQTSASTCAFMLYAVLKHPELLKRVTDEADALFSRPTLTAQGLHELDVTRRVVLETLRMYPAIPGLPRTVANSFEFAGYTVPARANVIIGNTVPHSLPECFKEPERFDIERYTPERAEHRQPGVFAPFGLGTHRCLGSSFAEVQIALTLLTIVRDFELRMSPPGYKLKVSHSPTPHPGPSFKFRVSPRRGNR